MRQQPFELSRTRRGPSPAKYLDTHTETDVEPVAVCEQTLRRAHVDVNTWLVLTCNGHILRLFNFNHNESFITFSQKYFISKYP